MWGVSGASGVVLCAGRGVLVLRGLAWCFCVLFSLSCASRVCLHFWLFGVRLGWWPVVLLFVGGFGHSWLCLCVFVRGPGSLLVGFFVVRCLVWGCCFLV